MASADSKTNVDRRGEADEPGMGKANCLCRKRGNKKAPLKGLISPRMGAFAWQLCCRAHARAYYDHAVFKHHALIGTALGTVRQLDAYPANQITASISRRTVPSEPAVDPASAACTGQNYP